MKAAFGAVPWAARTGVEPNFSVSRNCAIVGEACINQRINRASGKLALCGNRANKRSSSVRFCPKDLSGPRPGEGAGGRGNQEATGANPLRQPDLRCESLPVLAVGARCGGDPRSWEPQVRYSSQRYRVITYN